MTQKPEEDREETAAERTMRNIIDNPEALEWCSATLYKNTEWRDDWNDLDEWEKITWRNRTIDKMREFAALPEAVQVARNRMFFERRSRRAERMNEEGGEEWV